MKLSVIDFYFYWHNKILLFSLYILVSINLILVSIKRISRSIRYFRIELKIGTDFHKHII